MVAGAAVREGREDEPVTVQICPHQQDGPADRVQLDQLALAPEIVQMQPPAIPPAVAVERRTAVVEYAVRLDDLLASNQQSLDQVRRILDHVHVQPEHP